MATKKPEIEVDPITAALPPNSDYITYLTILEYQLTSERLPALTNHLVDDDGTLAKEIGWDLVKILLPLLDTAPRDAAKCLEVIARRGNPREVIVRVAEALEILGAGDVEDANSELVEESELGHPTTIQGEAERIHLGEMKLEGMPSQSSSRPILDQDSDMEKHQDTPDSSGGSGKRLSVLLSMLSLLHSRIKTQYPSRFLATSLPAALGAYRRIPITLQTTEAFLTLLGKLSGKQRPALPPRTSTANAKHLQSLPPSGTEVYAPLPDPEGGTDENAKVPSSLEKSIVQRLLQAVELEVLEEFLLAYPNTMEWSTRLYQKRAPRKTLPDRTSRLKAWQDEESLSSQDGIMRKFLRLAKDLGLSVEKVFKHTNLPPISDQAADSSGKEDQDEEESEFPTSPSQIPYPHMGSLFLFLASRVPTVVYSEEKMPLMEISTADLHHFVNQFVVPTPIIGSDRMVPSIARNQPSAADAMLSLFFLIEFPPKTPSIQFTSSSAVADDSESDYKSLIDILCVLSAENPDPFFRTSAHHLATSLVHEHPSPNFRLAIIKSTLADCHPFESLKEVAIGWLKDELLAATSKDHQSDGGGGGGGESNIFASRILLSSADEQLISLIFPEKVLSHDKAPSATHPWTSSPPTDPSTHQTKSNILQCIASLNLLFCLLSNPTLNARYHLASQLATIITTATEPSYLAQKANTFLTRIQSYLDHGHGHGHSHSDDQDHGAGRQQEHTNDEYDDKETRRETQKEFSLLALAHGRVVGVLDREKRLKSESKLDESESRSGEEKGKKEEEEEAERERRREREEGGSGSV